MVSGHLMMRLLFVIGLFCVSGCAIERSEFQPPHPSVLIYTEAEFAHADSEQPPGVYGPPQTLPDIWSGDKRFDTSPVGWYRFNLPDGKPEEPWAVMLAKFTQNIEVYFNGELIGRTAAPDEMPINFNRPFQFLLPTNYWMESGNQLEVRLTTMKNWGALTPIAVGPSQWIKLSFDQRFFFQITANQIAALVSLFLIIVSLLYWRMEAERTTYLWMAVVAACWLIYTLNNFLTSFPLPNEWWAILRRSSTDLFSFAYVAFVHRFLDLRRPVIEKIMLTYVVGMTVCYFIFYIVIEERLSYAFHAFTSVAGLYTAFITGRALLHNFDGRVLLLLGVIVTSTLFTVHDAIYATGYRIPGLIQEFYIGQVGVPVILCFLLLVIGRDFKKAAVAARRTNQELEARVEHISQELERSYQLRGEVERKHAAVMERNRIARDIHDDLGSKLLSLVYSAKSDEQATLARSALQDMRKIVSAVNPGDEEPVQDFGPVWHEEIAQRCREADVQLVWDSPTQLLLDGAHGGQLSSILRELVTNALKHAQCSRLEISARFEREVLVLSCADNGSGIEQLVAGNGMRNIKERAAMMDAQVNWLSSDSGGTRAVVELPPKQTP